MRTILFIAALFFSISMNAQPLFEKKEGNTKDEIIYNGEVSFGDLEREIAFKWFAEGARAYQPAAEHITALKKRLKHYDMVVLMGTWCEDSHNMIPRLYKVLRDTDYPFTRFKMYGLDRSKTGKNNEQEKYHVTSVPTVILYFRGTEVGRITELVDKSVEADLATMIEEFESE